MFSPGLYSCWWSLHRLKTVGYSLVRAKDMYLTFLMCQSSRSYKDPYFPFEMITQTIHIYLPLSPLFFSFKVCFEFMCCFQTQKLSIRSSISLKRIYCASKSQCTPSLNFRRLLKTTLCSTL